VTSSPRSHNAATAELVLAGLLDLSDALRKELVALPPRVVRRKIRDTSEEARLLLGAQASAGEQGLTKDVKQRLIQDGRNR